MASKRQHESEPLAQSTEGESEAKKKAYQETMPWKFIKGVFSLLRKDCPEFGILLIGETGTGKSTLINNLVGQEVASVCDDMNPGTLRVIQHKISVVEGVIVNIYDTPGLGDTRGNGAEEEDLKYMKSRLDKEEIHLVIYCFKMTETRMRKGLIRTFEEYHRCSVPWEKTVITLTFADMYRKENIMTQISQKQEQVKKTLTKMVGIRQSTVEKLKFLPTAKDPNEALPTGEPWYVPLWLGVLEVLAPDALVLFHDMHKGNFNMEIMSPSSKPKFVSITLAGEDKERYLKCVKVIQNHAEEFLNEMNSKEIATQLRALELIPQSVESDILQSRSMEEANAHLLIYLKEDADEKTVGRVFRIACEKKGLPKMDVFASFMIKKLQHKSEAEMQKQRYSPLPASGSVGGDSGQPLLPGWECQLVRGGKRLYTATRQTSWDRPSPEEQQQITSGMHMHEVTIKPQHSSQQNHPNTSSDCNSDSQSDVGQSLIELVDEDRLQQLCYMAAGIKHLLIGPDGGTFTLGCGDATLKIPPGAVKKEISVHYAIILHGPFVLPTGYKPGSVVVYINMDGAILMKPIELLLSHWCIREEEDGKETLKFVHAPHTLEAGQEKYTFEEEEEADFVTFSDVGILTIRESHCLFCVETKNETIAKYSAIAFSHYIQSEDTLLFRIQLMCDSREWNEMLTNTLQKEEWKRISDSNIVARFQYAAGYHQITADPTKLSGPGWEAAICGPHAVIDTMFLATLSMSKKDIEGEINSGRFPPCILYQIIYTSPEERRVKPAMMKVDVYGADVPLSFICRVKEELIALPALPASSGPTSNAATSLSSMKTAPVPTRAEQVLVQLRDRFIRAVDANAIVHNLRCVNIISDGVLTTVTGNPNTKQQNQFLHAYLQRTCTEEALAEVCDLLTAVQGNRKMNDLGKDMKSELEKVPQIPTHCPPSSGPGPTSLQAKRRQINSPES